MVEFAEHTFGALHIAFNNAGVMLDGDGDAESTGEEIWQRTLAINLTGVYLGCKFEVPALRRAGGGSIINTGSFVASMGAATPQLAYTASKGYGVVALSRELAAVHARESIRVNSLCPGPLRTKLLMVCHFLDTDEKRNRRLVHVPMGRFGEAAEMARAALFLRCLPGVRRLVLHHRLRADGRWWDHHDVRDAGIARHDVDPALVPTVPLAVPLGVRGARWDS